MPVLPMEQVETAYYLRITALDQPGVMARIAGILGEEGISIEAISRRSRRRGHPGAAHHAQSPSPGRAHESGHCADRGPGFGQGRGGSHPGGAFGGLRVACTSRSGPTSKDCGSDFSPTSDACRAQALPTQGNQVHTEKGLRIQIHAANGRIDLLIPGLLGPIPVLPGGSAGPTLFIPAPGKGRQPSGRRHGYHQRPVRALRNEISPRTGTRRAPPSAVSPTDRTLRAGVTGSTQTPCTCARIVTGCYSSTPAISAWSGRRPTPWSSSSTATSPQTA